VTDATQRLPPRGLGSAEPGTERAHVDSGSPTVLGEPDGAFELGGGQRAWTSDYCFQGNEAPIGCELAEAVCAALAAPTLSVAAPVKHERYWRCDIRPAWRPRVTMIAERGKVLRRAGARCAALLQWWKVGTPCGWVTGLDWLCDVDAVRRLIANGLCDEVFVASKPRSLYTLAWASARIRGQEHV